MRYSSEYSSSKLLDSGSCTVGPVLFGYYWRVPITMRAPIDLPFTGLHEKPITVRQTGATIYVCPQRRRMQTDYRSSFIVRLSIKFRRSCRIAVRLTGRGKDVKFFMETP